MAAGGVGAGDGLHEGFLATREGRGGFVDDVGWPCLDWFCRE